MSDDFRKLTEIKLPRIARSPIELSECEWIDVNDSYRIYYSAQKEYRSFDFLVLLLCGYGMDEDPWNENSKVDLICVGWYNFEGIRTITFGGVNGFLEEILPSNIIQIMQSLQAIARLCDIDESSL